MKKKVVLAYSGGLDTSYCARYFSTEKNYDVFAVLVNTGGFSSAELAAVEQTATELGVASFKSIDVTQDYYEDCIRYLIFGNILKNNTYPLSVSAERAFQAMAIARYAKEIGADYLAHGSTGAGNDQVRFDMIFNIVAPGIEILTPIRDKQLSREQEINYLKQTGVRMDWHKAAYSINQGIWGTSVGGKETLTSHLPLPEDAFPGKISEDQPRQISIQFEKGRITGLNGSEDYSAVKLIEELNRLGSAFGLGRDMHIGDTIIGIKGRVAFEAPAALMIIKAHETLEKHVLSKWQIHWKNQLAEWYGMLLHEGQFLDPVMRNIEKFLEDTQTTVNGTVFLQLAPHYFQVDGIKSDNDLMSSKFGEYGEQNLAWSADDVRGFAKMLATQSKIYHAVNETEFK